MTNTAAVQQLGRQHVRPRAALPLGGEGDSDGRRAVVFWIGWHILQIRAENRELEEEARRLREGDNLQKAVQDEHTPERM